MKYIVPNWQVASSIKAYTTLRNSFGMGAKKDSQKLIELLQLPSAPNWLDQVHSNTVLSLPNRQNETVGDASFTKQRRHICVVQTADCLPILICDKEATHVAAIHAGWRGLAKGIIANTVLALGLPPENLQVWLGPAIGPDSFEVGVEVYEAFTQHLPSVGRAFKEHGHQKWLANLYQLATDQLISLGIKHISGGHHCTFTEADLFYSYRRDGKETGRMASVIWID